MHLAAGTVHWFRWNKGGQMIAMTGRVAASAIFEHIDREISPESPDLERLVAISAEHQLLIKVPS